MGGGGGGGGGWRGGGDKGARGRGRRGQSQRKLTKRKSMIKMKILVNIGEFTDQRFWRAYRPFRVQ